MKLRLGGTQTELSSCAIQRTQAEAELRAEEDKLEDLLEG